MCRLKINRRKLHHLKAENAYSEKERPVQLSGQAVSMYGWKKEMEGS